MYAFNNAWNSALNDQQEYEAAQKAFEDCQNNQARGANCDCRAEKERRDHALILLQLGAINAGRAAQKTFGIPPTTGDPNLIPGYKP